MEIIIRKADLKDIKDITKIYNEAIIETVATFDIKIKTLEDRKNWFKNHSSKNPILVAIKNRDILGFASLSKYSNKCAYSDTAELSLYIKKEHQGKGYGKRLLKSVINEGEKVGLHTVISRITEGNQMSINLHKSVGFEQVGIIKEAGKKFGKLLDVYIMQKIYK